MGIAKQAWEKDGVNNSQRMVMKDSFDALGGQLEKF